MKRGILVLLGVVILGGILAGGWWWARTSPEQAVDFLANGGLERGRAEQVVAVLGGQLGAEQEEVVLVASGSIEGETVAVVSEFGGRISGLYADEGDEVSADELVVELDAGLLQAQRAQAVAAVAAADANLASVQAGTHPAEIVAARAGLRKALAERDAAETAWKNSQSILDNPQEIDAQVVKAQSDLELAGSQIEQYEAKLASAVLERDRYKAQGSFEEKELYASYNYQVEAAQAALEGARANRKAAEHMLEALKAYRSNPLVLVSQVNMAESRYKMAAAAVGVALAHLDELKAGPLPAEVAVAEAQVAQAEAAVSALDARIAKMRLRAPMAGVVTSRSAHRGEAAVPGATLLTIANLDEVTLTIYIPEDKLGWVYLGQEVEVQVDSFPGRAFTGTVSHISQQAEFTPKNVQTEEERVNMVFAVKVRLPNVGHMLKPGMPADAYIGER